MGFQRTNAVTEPPAKLDRGRRDSVSPAHETQGLRAESITAGLEWLLAARRDDHWTDFSTLNGTADLWVTAYVLARLGEVPERYISYSLRQQIGKSLDCLERARIAGSGWRGPSGMPDAFVTSWAIIALRSHRRSVPQSSMDMILRCRQANGGFSAYPQDTPGDTSHNVSSPEITATALRAIRTPDSAGTEFLASHLQNDLPPGALGRTSRLYICSELLDCENVVPPWSLLNRISRWITPLGVEKPHDQALLLRSLLRLRNQRAWALAAALREMQLGDGSWPACAVLVPSAQVSATANTCFADRRTMTTAAAVSALVINESQPGLYFGSDLPRRLGDC